MGLGEWRKIGGRDKGDRAFIDRLLLFLALYILGLIFTVTL
jgi:hypothetical protein